MPLGLVLLATFLSFVRTLGFQFVCDDLSLIVGNSHLLHWSSLPLYFTQHMLAHVVGAPALFYRPLVLVWFRINEAVFGLTPVGWHATTVLVHVAATALVYVLAKDLLREHFPAIASAVIFGLHPVHIENVAWVSGVSDPLCAVLLLSCYILFRRVRQVGKGWYAVASVVLFAVAQITKETAIVWPFVLFADAVLFYEPGRAFQRLTRASIRVLPFVVVALVYLVVRAHVLSRGIPDETEMTLRTALLTVPSCLSFYVTQLVWPVHLSFFYDLKTVSSPGGVNFYFPLLAAMLAASVSVYALCRLRANESESGEGSEMCRAIALGLVTLFATLAPVLYIAHFEPGDVVHDRYLYLPSIGFAILCAGLLQIVRKRSGAGAQRWQVVALSAMACVMATGILVQSSPWHDDWSLYSHASQVSPLNPIANTNVAALLINSHHPEQALPILDRVIRSNPDFIQSYITAGDAYLKLYQLDRAENLYNFALARSQNVPSRLHSIRYRLDVIQRVRQDVAQQNRTDPHNHDKSSD